VVEKFTEFTAMPAPIFPPFMHKIEPQQISEAIGAIDKKDAREHQSKKIVMRYGLIYFLVSVGLIIFFTYYLSKDDPELFRAIITVIVTAVVSFVGGYGLGSRKRS
jgi:SNF family Na+-dependent transporter